MLYSIGEVSKITNLTISTLRYYDKEGLLIDLKRNSNSRIFDEQALNSLKLIECLKRSGLEIKGIRNYMQLAKLGDATLKERYEIILEQEKKINKKIEELNEAYDLIRFKKWYYQEAIKENNEEKVKNMKIEEMPKDIQILFNKTHHID